MASSKYFTLKKALAAICSVSVLGFGLSTQATAADGKPNFVTIVIDDMGFSDLGAFGSEIATPNLNQIATSGAMLTNFYSAPTSTPARAMFFTGKDNHKAGVGNMDGYVANRPAQVDQFGYEGKLSPDVMIFPEMLQANGYETMMVGKWDLGDQPGEDAHDRGFTHSLVLLPGGDMHYLSDSQGKLITSQPPTYYAALGRKSPYSQDGVEFSAFPPNAFSTEFYTNTAMQMLDGWAANGKKSPFYLNIAHIASHAPFQSPPDLIEKYLPTYSQGWDVIREQRFNRIKALGLIPQNAEMPPRQPEVVPWASLSLDQQKIEAKRMATYAGLVEMLDRSVGELVQHLKDIGEYDNTVFMIFSDNGAAAVEAGSPAKVSYVNSHFSRDTVDKLDEMGGPHSFLSAVAGWGMVSNTPLNRFKAETFEGGMHTAAMVYYPKQNPAVAGTRYDCLMSVMDFAPTIMDLAGVTPPATFKGKPNAPFDGASIASLFEGNLSCENPFRALAFEMDGAKMVRRGNWKLAQQWDSDHQRWDDTVYLFNLADDPFERHNLAAKEPEQFEALWSIYEDYAQANGVIPVGPRLYGSTSLGTALNKSHISVGDDAMMIGGIQINYSNIVHATVANAKVGDTADISGEIYVPNPNVGKAGDTVVIVRYQPSANKKGVWLTIGSAGEEDNSGFMIKRWDKTSEGLATFGSYSPDEDGGLPEFIEMPIYEGAVGPVLGRPGIYSFWIGYRLNSGTVIRSEAPFTLNVARKSLADK